MSGCMFIWMVAESSPLGNGVAGRALVVCATFIGLLVKKGIIWELMVLVGVQERPLRIVLEV